MSKDVQKLIDDFLTEVKPIDERREAILAELNAQLNHHLLKPAKDNAKKFLIDGDREKARRALMELHALMKEPFPDLETHLREPLKVSPEVQDLLDQFLEENQKRIQWALQTLLKSL